MEGNSPLRNLLPYFLQIKKKKNILVNTKIFKAKVTLVIHLSDDHTDTEEPNTCDNNIADEWKM